MSRYNPDAAVVTQRLIVERIRGAVTHMRHLPMEHSRESFDYGAMVADQLTVWLARLPERGTLTVEWPATWWDHFKLDVLAPWILRRVPTFLGWLARRLKWKMTRRRYEAALYFPAVHLPSDLRQGEFYVWNHGEEIPQ